MIIDGCVIVDTMDTVRKIEPPTTDYNRNYLESLRNELVEIVQDRLSPLAMRYHYAQVPLESNIKWKPSVLLIGNYSSGKSTLINELIGADVQMTGQAPTDDSFTVITTNPTEGSDESVIIRDGQVLLNDPQYPFAGFRKFGKRFAAHFRLKLVKSPLLHNLALIDTPGMLDSVSEKDRGYDYQEVIGDLAQIADLILIIFDPHKAGTVKEVYQSLRETLPNKSFEDRVLFVLNRVDECENINDLLRVYGTLCWNLSQMTGRKDIPAIHITYSDYIYQSKRRNSGHDYLEFLQNQRDLLKEGIFAAPRHRLDHLASYIELHSERLVHLLGALLNHVRRLRRCFWQSVIYGVIPAIVIVGIFYLVLRTELDPLVLTIILAIVGLAIAGGSILVGKKLFVSRYYRKLHDNPQMLVTLNSQAEIDCWDAVKDTVKGYIARREPLRSAILKKELRKITQVRSYTAAEVRRAIAEYEGLRDK